MKNRIFTIILTVIIILPLFLSSCADETGISIESSTADKSFLKELKNKAGFDDNEDQNGEKYDDEFLDKLSSYAEDHYDPDEWEEQKQEIFEEKLNGMSESEMEEYIIDRYNKSLYTEDEIKELFAYAFQKGYEYGKNDIMDDTAKYYINNFNFTKQEINIYDIDWNFTDITVEMPTEAPKETKSQPADDEIYIISLTNPAYQGNNATIKIKGKPNTEYSIAVYYKSGASQADGLHKKTSNANGEVSWTWRVGARTSPGTYKITITGGGESYQTTFTVK